jgi:metal-responsive CopG/Arc/MetJ family transcriptional regulator
MNAVRVNISLSRDILEDLNKEVGPRKRSRFVAEAIRRLLNERRAERLAAEYEQAAAEIKRVSQELEGAISDGLD